MSPLVLVVDDEPQMTAIVDFALKTAGFQTVVCHSGRAAWDEFQKRAVDLVILDLMLPDVSGITIAQRIRAHSGVPIIMLTALGDVEQRVAGLSAGADDYLAKPFSPQELILRAQAIVRRSGALEHEEPDLHQGDLKIETNTKRVFVKDELVDLTETETKLLRSLLARAGEVVPVRTLLNEVWDTTATQGGRNMVKTTVYRLRKKLRDAGLSEDAIESVRGRGYTFAIA